MACHDFLPGSLTIIACIFIPGANEFLLLCWNQTILNSMICLCIYFGYIATSLDIWFFSMMWESLPPIFIRLFITSSLQIIPWFLQKFFAASVPCIPFATSFPLSWFFMTSVSRHLYIALWFNQRGSHRFTLAPLSVKYGSRYLTSCKA